VVCLVGLCGWFSGFVDGFASFLDVWLGWRGFQNLPWTWYVLFSPSYVLVLFDRLCEIGYASG